MRIAADTDLASDDRDVVGVGLAFAPVALEGAVDGPAGVVEEGLIAVEQDGDDQDGVAVGQIDT